VEDLAGLKIRSGGGISEEMARALGASAFVKPAPECYELLSSGVADGTFFPLDCIASFKLGTVITVICAIHVILGTAMEGYR
jgi:TRAP-type transport system periplasmic protein